MADDMVYVIPKEGGTVRHPVTMTPVPAVGQFIPTSGTEASYWLARINDGSLIITAPPTADPASSSASSESATRTRRGGADK